MKVQIEQLRAAVFIDLENIVHPERVARDLEGAVARVEALLAQVRSGSEIVLCEAVCDRSLARWIAPALWKLGVRVHPHPGGVDEADRRLLERIEHDLPATCGLVVLASGDHFFAQSARQLKHAGRRVQVVARAGSISAELYTVVDDFIDLTSCAAACHAGAA